ncbi:MAG: transcription-repair coupling factor, partial [Clostridiales bacterium]|nr:transcription-repair coupling factor [Clostridiales bacterium]
MATRREEIAVRLISGAHLFVALAFLLGHLRLVNSLRKSRALLDLLASKPSVPVSRHNAGVVTRGICPNDKKIKKRKGNLRDPSFFERSALLRVRSRKLRIEDILTPQGELKELCDGMADKQKISAFGLMGNARFAVSAFARRFVYVCADVSGILPAADTFTALGLKTAIMPQKDDVLSCAYTRSTDNEYARLSALAAYLSGGADVLLCSASVLTALYPKRATLAENIFTVKKGETVMPETLVHRLVRLGYVRSEQVTEKGSFALRGDILDIFGIGDDECRRVEFFGDEVDSIRAFDPADQRAGEHRDLLTVYPATDIFLADEDAAAVAAKLRGKHSSRFEGVAQDTAVRLSSGDRSVRLSYVLPLCPHENFAEFFDGDTVIFDDCKAVADGALALVKEHEARFKNLFSTGDTFAFCRDACAFEKTEGKGARLAFHKIDGQNRLFTPNTLCKFESAELPDYSRDLPSLLNDAEIWARRGIRVTVFCGTADMARHLNELSVELHKGGGAEFCSEYLPHGGVFFGCDRVLVGTKNVTRRVVTKAIRRSARDAFVLPDVGDYVVHRIHGIGLCEDITKLNFGGAERDYVVVRYAGGDKLYLPIENLDSLSKLVAGEHPKLSKIGGVEFARLKDKVRQSVKDMALGLTELYAKRQEAKGTVYSEDDTLLDEFCADFPFEETEDQRTATEEGLADLKKGKIMDRLLCGDVGFGKTEVAMRLAFKVICEGKQVAFVSPTTILARQHFETVKARMEKFGVHAVQLTRFCSAAETKAALSDLASGKADIVCGTHRALSKDVIFKDLGLLILDEEQRFGVADKEKIKRLKVNVNVLALSATPIPRTLHMSMVGIRDISVLDTPPADRLPVQTYVTEYSDALAADAIGRETGRGGQVFIVYNRVADIDSFAARVHAAVPNVKVAVAHGQMDKDALERVIEDFARGETDVLVASTIIENGIDMPRANTMIVIDSDRLGLAQMYQLRGRVGRSNRLAYVYFTYDPNKMMSEEAYKRLDAITQYTELSSGFKIALRDLEIRGAGNVLGREQHGHIEKVGYDMYCKILQSVVEELRGGEQTQGEEKADVKVICDFAAFIPETYVKEKDWRVRLYARISHVKSREEVRALLADMEDVYGAVPAAAVNLARLGFIKNGATNAGASGVTIRNGAATLVFSQVKNLP